MMMMLYAALALLVAFSIYQIWSIVTEVKRRRAALAAQNDLVIDHEYVQVGMVFRVYSVRDRYLGDAYVLSVLHVQQDDIAFFRRRYHGLNDEVLYHMQWLNGPPDHVGLRVALWQLECQ